MAIFLLPKPELDLSHPAGFWSHAASYILLYAQAVAASRQPPADRAEGWLRQGYHVAEI